ncbi:sulfotransferase domain-containing protein [Prochlorococcus sp. MIT 1300]|uniref:sulfotransferase domain-containing protein n=1 Tax=Prochlorococcus sp. MIT 1300 TaxID=3096218 RepID=UPI002A7504BE|nr:sulfotransferase domain-containing protein [Prochlorococcus sp. MIT 1300]
MTIIKIKFNDCTLSASEKVNAPLMVCSHERSGTHFLMNSINNSSEYTCNPFLDFDYHNLGNAINFFDSSQIADFLVKIKSFKEGGKPFYMNSIIKSHFPIEFVKEAVDQGMKIAYIYRDPYEVILSYWRFVCSLDWFEAPSTASPLELAKHIPEGRSQRYQLKTHANYFERWAYHVSSALIMAENNPNIWIIFYEDLLERHSLTMKQLYSSLSLECFNEITLPKKSQTSYIKGNDIPVTLHQELELRKFCSLELEKYPNLASLLSARKREK